jgi:hypothetical protein
MATYREEIDKIYKKIDSIVSKGDEYYLDYNEYIDSIVNGGQFTLLNDVLYFKYGIDGSNFRNVNDLKKSTFQSIKITTKNVQQKKLAQLFDQKGVYTLGVHYFDKVTSKYLGDIIEYDNGKIDPNTNLDTDLYKVLNENKNFFVLAKISDSIGLRESIPPFITSLSNIIKYNPGAMVRYENLYFECARTYTWSKENQILPTDAVYWNQLIPSDATYSLFYNSSDKLLDKYSKAIDFINGNNYIYTYINDFMEGDYVDDYLE